MFNKARRIVPKWFRRHLFSSAASGPEAARPRSAATKIFFRTLRVARVVGVSYGIYQVGYRNGLTDYLEHPEEQQRGLIEAVLSMSNSTDVLDQDSAESKFVTAIAQRVLDTARLIAKEELEIIESEVAKAGKEDLALMKEKRDEAHVAVRRLAGNWNFFVTDSSEVNAFVTDILPKSIFINVGLLQTVKPTVDELAMILAHELSHVIHDHNKERSLAQAVIYAVQLVLFALVDPTGQASLLFDFVMGKVVEILIATHSRANEEEADLTGVKIMSRACYNAVEGSNIFIKLGALRPADKSKSWTDTHPSSETRAKYIKEAIELHAPSADCREIKNDLWLSKKYLHDRKR